MALDRALDDEEFDSVRRYRLNLEQGDRIIDSPPVDTLVTVVTFKGDLEVGRAIAKTDPDYLRAFVRRAVNSAPL